MVSFEHLLRGNVLILGEKNKERDLDNQIRKNLKNGEIFYNKSDNKQINNIIITQSIDLYLVDLSSHSFSSRIMVFKGDKTVFNGAVVQKYLIDRLDYKKTDKSLYVSEYTREKVKILYLYSIYNKYVQHIKKNISTYCNNRKYEFVYKFDKDFDKIKPKFNIIRKELQTCNTMLILYNYSFIVEHNKSLDMFLTFNKGLLDKDIEPVMIIDNIYGEWFNNFVIFNKLNTIDTLHELTNFFSRESINELQISQYLKAHKFIKNNQFIPLFHDNTNKGYIGCFNGGISLFELEKNLPFYLNLYKTNTMDSLYNSIYLKEYSYRISDSLDINRMKFSFRGRLEISKTNHTYKSLDTYIYEITIDKTKFMVYFGNDYEYFKGIEMDSSTPRKIEGILIII